MQFRGQEKGQIYLDLVGFLYIQRKFQSSQKK